MTSSLQSTFVRRLRLRNFKSIAACDVTLGPLCFLVGPNGAGKSNVLDALDLVSQALGSTLDVALRDRGGIDEVRRRSTGHPHHTAIELDLLLERGRARFTFELDAGQGGSFRVRRERLTVVDETLGRHGYDVQDGELVASSLPHMPRPNVDRLFLVMASGFEPFRESYDRLLAMAFHDIDPAPMRDLQAPEVGARLTRDGRNVASVLHRMAEEHPGATERVRELLSEIVGDVRDVERVALAHQETLLFKQQVKGAKHPWRFYAGSMSDGTLRALGVLVALFQHGASPTGSLIAIEEPSAALHPLAAKVLLGALRDASQTVQVLATSHAPQLLDDEAVEPTQILGVSSEDGITSVGPIDAEDLEALRQGSTAGELLAQGRLRPGGEMVHEVEQLDLFGDVG